MAFKLLDIGDGKVSLEFSETDRPLLQIFLAEEFDDIQIFPGILHRILSFAGCDFIFLIEWDDPCLISQCAQGTRILRVLAETLSD